MIIKDKADYDAAVARAHAISDAPEGAAEAREHASLVAAIRAWDEAGNGEQSHGREPEPGLTSPDDLPVSGLPGNLGKLHLD